MLELISLCFSAMVLLCLAMEKHREQVADKTLPNIVIKSFKPSGWLLLMFTAYLSIEQFGWSIGPPCLFGALTIAILLLTLLLTYRATIAPKLAIILSLIASVSLLNS